MTITDAQRDVRTVFVGGFAGQMVSSAMWFASAVIAILWSRPTAMVVLFVGGFFIFPMTQLVLRLMGRPYSLPKGHPMNALGMQVAFVLPLSLPLALAATAYRQNWFYPAVMILLGAHYLPFIFMYGMWQYGVLSGLLISSGLLIAIYLPSIFSFGGWSAAVILLVFAFVARGVALGESGRGC